MNVIKLVVSGPVGAGKTTFINALADGETVETDEMVSDGLHKPRTTVAMDFATLTLEDWQIHLFGTPGQDRFDFMWEVLCEGAFGLVLLVDGARPADFPAARGILEFVTSRIPVPFVVGVTHQDLPRVWEPQDVGDYFELSEHLTLGLDARDPVAGLGVLEHLLTQLDSARALPGWPEEISAAVDGLPLS